MGVINFGAPIRDVIFLKELMQLENFVEGGTFRGLTALAMSNIFKDVITIEKSERMFSLSSRKLDGISNIRLIKGDTRKWLPEITSQNKNILFWLDAHWSGGETYGHEDECPLLEELKTIFESQINCAILIDDARLFLAPPPLPHSLEQWPTFSEILKTLPPGWDLMAFEDVIYVLPSEVMNKFRAMIQIEISRKVKNHKFFHKILFRTIKHNLNY